MTELVDLLGQVRFERSSEEKREGLSLQTGALAFHHRGHPLQLQIERVAV